MNGDGMHHFVEREREPEQPAPMGGDPFPDIARLPTIRLVSPATSGQLLNQRSDLAAEHQQRAHRLREMADRAMTVFDRDSAELERLLTEWAELRDVPRRSPAEDERFAELTGELLDAEGRLGRQWDALARMLREAAHHEASAEILQTGHYRG